MKRIKNIIMYGLVLFSAINIHAQTEEEIYLAAEDARTQAALNIEKEIRTQILDSLPTFVLSQVQQDSIVAQMAHEYDSIPAIPQVDLDIAFEDAKKQLIREAYFTQHPEVWYLYDALPYGGTYRQRYCINPGFENINDLTNPTGSYSFRNRRFVGISNQMQACLTNINTQLFPYTPSNPPVTNNDPVTIMTPPAPEPLLNAMAIPSVPSTVFAGNASIRLNQPTGGYDITSMSKTFTIDDPVNPPTITFNYLLLMWNGHPNAGGNVSPFFRIQIFDNTNSLTQQFCFRANDTDAAFAAGGINITTAGSLRYTAAWQQFTVNLPNTGMGTNATIVFTIGDCNANGHFAMVYLDDLCIRNNCPATLNITNPVLAASNGESEETSDWITASNIINPLNVATNNTVYHAGNFVELLPGFDALAGSRFAAYPLGCTNTFPYRPSVSNGEAMTGEAFKNFDPSAEIEKLRVFPNPASATITVSYGFGLKSIKIMSMDGKLVASQDVNAVETEIEISALKNGLYLISSETFDAKTLQSKFIKN